MIHNIWFRLFLLIWILVSMFFFLQSINHHEREEKIFGLFIMMYVPMYYMTKYYFTDNGN